MLPKFNLIYFILLAAFWTTYSTAKSPWGEKYFPNTTLISHEGEEVKFFDDLIKNKIVAINFIYTSCPDVCPLETAQLTRVQNILGERLGSDIHFYSISIDPEKDSPEILAEYRKRFGAKWSFFTGDKEEIIELRRKLGLYVDGIDTEDNKNNHNVSMIIGNQKTGRWMKRSPFENPYVLADQLGNWLTGWTPVQSSKSYADAPSLRPLTRGEPIFRTRCSSCHSISGVEAPNSIGPDLAGVTKKREQQWLVNWLRAPDKMIADKDPLALALLKKYNNLPMPNLRLNKQEISDLLAFLDQHADTERDIKPEETFVEDKLATMNAWVKFAHADARTNAGYITFFNMNDKPVTIVSASSPEYASVEFHEMSMSNGMMDMKELKLIPIMPAQKVAFVPGGKHLMLNNPIKPLLVGDKVNINLRFADGSQQVLTLIVRAQI